MRQGIEAIQDTLISEIVSFYPETQAVYVFGSAAAGKEHEGSDIDIALLFDPKQAQEIGNLSQSDLNFRIQELTKKNADLINLRLVSTVFKKEIIFNGIMIYSSGLFHVQEFEMLTMSYYQKLNEERKEILEEFYKSKRAYMV